MPLRVAGDKGEARQLQRLVGQGKLRRIHQAIYTDDLEQPIEAVTRRHLYEICSLIVPGGVISHRSAFEQQKPTPAGNYFLTGPYRRDIDLPGLKLRIAEGPGPLESDIRLPTLHGDAYISGQPRALLENLSTSRGPSEDKRTLGAVFVEEWLDRFIARDVNNAINQIRDSARDVAVKLGWDGEFKQLDATIGSLLGTRSAKLTAPSAIARAARSPYDDARLRLFDVLAEELQKSPLQVPFNDPDSDSQLQAFVETYFSNYIEGTEFEIEEAHDIVVNGRPLKYREDDSHDILGTYQAVLQSKRSPVIADSAEAFVRQLQGWNRQVIESRADKSPGTFKDAVNRAGNTVFVHPDMVMGTLIKGYETIMSATTHANRAALAMFVVTEIHPFADGNGRTARVAMNHFLSSGNLTRIIVPTVFREDYILSLKAMTNGNAAPMPRMLERAARFSHWLNMSSTQACFAALTQSNAMARSDDAKLIF